MDMGVCKGTKFFLLLILYLSLAFEVIENAPIYLLSIWKSFGGNGKLVRKWESFLEAEVGIYKRKQEIKKKKENTLSTKKKKEKTITVKKKKKKTRSRPRM